MSEPADLLVRRDVPKTKRLVVTGGDHSLAVRCEGDSGDQFRMTLQRTERGTGIDIPESHDVVATSAREHSSIAREREAMNLSLMARQHMPFLLAFDLPEFDFIRFRQSSPGPRGEHSSVGAEAGGNDDLAVRAEPRARFSAVHVPEFDFAGRVGLSSPQGECFAIGRNRDRREPARGWR